MKNLEQREQLGDQLSIRILKVQLHLQGHGIWIAHAEAVKSGLVHVVAGRSRGNGPSKGHVMLGRVGGVGVEDAADGVIRASGLADDSAVTKVRLGGLISTVKGS